MITKMKIRQRTENRIVGRIIEKYFSSNPSIYKFEYSKCLGRDLPLSLLPNEKVAHYIHYYPNEAMLEDNSWCKLEQKINKIKHKYNIFINMTCCVENEDE